MKYRKHLDALSSLVCTGIGITFLVSSFKYGDLRSGIPNAGFSPFLGGLLLTILSSVMLISTIKKKESNEKENIFPEKSDLPPKSGPVFKLGFWHNMDHSWGGQDGYEAFYGGVDNMTFLAPASSLPSIKAGSARALAVTSKTRNPMLPDVPTTKELGYPQIDAVVSAGISGPPNLPSHVVDIWNQTLKKALGDPRFTSRYDKVGVPLEYLNSNELKELVLKEMVVIKKLWGVK